MELRAIPLALKALLPTGPREAGTGPFRQYHRHAVLQQAGRSGIVVPVSRDSPPLEVVESPGHISGCEPPGGIHKRQGGQT